MLLVIGACVLGGSGCALIAFRNCRDLTTVVVWSGDMVIDDFSVWQFTTCKHG